MRFKKINIEVSSSFWIKQFDSKGLNFEQGDLGQLRIGKRLGNLQLVVKGKLFTIEARESVRRDEIIREFGRGNENLVEISQVYRQKDWPETEIQIELSLAWFNGPAIELGTIDIALDPRTLEQASEIGLGTNFNEVSKHLFDSCNLALTDESDQNFAVAILGSEALDNLKEIEQLDLIGDAREEQQKAVIKNGLVLLGDDIQVAVQKYSGVKFDYLGVKKVVTRSHSAPSRALRLVKLTLSFSDQLQEISSQVIHKLNEILEGQNGYLATWDRYGASEGENLLCKARTIGRIEISPDQCQLEDGKLSIYIDQDLRDLLTPQDSIIMVSPEYSIAHLDDSEMDWKAFSEQMFNNYKASKGFESGLSSWQSKTAKHEGESDIELADKVVSISGEPVQILSVVKVDQHRIVVKEVNKPNHNMVLALSILGDQVQIERRMTARSAIVSGKSAMPHLGLLIEEEASLPAGRDQRNILDPLSTFVEKKIFPENPPTYTQKQAIEIALNTPDIVIIQGPPGTGKTTVITAIIERLNETLDKSKSLQGDILVSGYQHDAVENLLNRLSVNDLPAIKFGQRSGEAEQSSTTEIKLDEWRQQTMQRVYLHAPELKENFAYQQLERELGAYTRQPSNGAALRLVNKARVLLTGVRGSDGLVELLKTLSLDLGSQQQDNSVLIQLLRSIRISETAFMDDGPSRAAALQGWLNEQGIDIAAADQETLQRAMSWQAEESLGFLSQLKDLKGKLLKQFTPRPQLQREMVRADVSSALSKALDLLQGNSRLAAKERALVEYLGDLEGNPRLVQDALAEYNLVYGATVQQSEHKTIRRFKSKAGDGKGYLQYGTVIVDEAARTSPRDLMIPMVQAKDRIILVGDHRQLPHIIDESILEQMEQELEESDSQAGREQFNQHIKESMFQYLFQRAKQLEQQDGIARTITLDAQYRSHPLLGQFASDQFYKPYGEAYSSPLPARLFSHQLEGIESKAAIWLDVPAQKGPESQNENKSRYRTSEARAIAKQLKQWIDSEAGKGLSFGVISFYTAQVTEIMKELEKYQITERDEQVEYVITREYQMLFDGDGKAKEERLRIGTVDSFQGMEFDVVFLSMVRTQVSNSKFLKDRAYSPKDQRSVFGHLMSKNRLCVSVTRQKKALILVGDSQLAQAPIASQAVPELQEFHRLCRTDSQGKLI